MGISIPRAYEGSQDVACELERLLETLPCVAGGRSSGVRPRLPPSGPCPPPPPPPPLPPPGGLLPRGCARELRPCRPPPARARLRPAVGLCPGGCAGELGRRRAPAGVRHRPDRAPCTRPDAAGPRHPCTRGATGRGARSAGITRSISGAISPCSA